MREPFTLIPGRLSLQDIRQVIFQRHSCSLARACFAKIDAANKTVEAVIAKNEIVYGINTGFGSLANQVISSENLQQLQRNIVLSHACGTGELLDDDIVAMILLLKINSLAQGFSGVRQQVIDALLAFYNAGVYPCIPAKGSVGASGDLVPLAHMSLPLLGVGSMRYEGKLVSAEEGLSIAKVVLMQLAPKEGLALLNGLQVSAAMAIKAWFVTRQLFDVAILAGSLSVEAARGSIIPFDERIHLARGQAAQCYVAKLYRTLLAGSDIRASRTDDFRVQDPYSLRCQPQIMGSVWHQIVCVGDTLEIEANAVSDNPLVFVEEGDILSGGNFHGEFIAMAADNLALAIAEMGANAERRIALLIDKNVSGLPAFLVQNGGLNSGFMIAHVTAASCASDNKALAHPHSVDSLPTSANQEDHVSMSTNAARRLFEMIDNTVTILAIELLAACQGLEFHKPLATSPRLQGIYDEVRASVAPYTQDRYFAPDIAIIKEKILAGAFVLTE